MYHPKTISHMKKIDIQEFPSEQAVLLYNRFSNK